MAARNPRKDSQVGVTLKRKVPKSQLAQFKAQAKAQGYKVSATKKRRPARDPLDF